MCGVAADRNEGSGVRSVAGEGGEDDVVGDAGQDGGSEGHQVAVDDGDSAGRRRHGQAPVEERAKSEKIGEADGERRSKVEARKCGGLKTWREFMSRWVGLMSWALFFFWFGFLELFGLAAGKVEPREKL